MDQLKQHMNGTAWTAGLQVPAVGPGWDRIGCTGTQTAGLSIGGIGDPPFGVTTELWIIMVLLGQLEHTSPAVGKY